MISLGSTPNPYTCSRAGCLTTATWVLEWRNPRIHDEQRRKSWLACGEHLEFLSEFLRAREFPLQVRPLATIDHETAR
ncbi:hypothetical protein [Rathayibacter toxicus]|uniref:Acetone carboxylase n=1 Tax=Rathayibacter toxicus TaxID=145458 RepID=A0A0C5BEH9_9MICO|nr:hypothetical protein [Rathayibacter toxicus]AJM77701.1 hypothetical protein TI83_06620 [Rathayibacter toxicus]ALS58136.1 hypothetical protein APU90_10465 [Rathayibacter toxicus]KKM45342.1 hypothetical protein VT73_06850 [Rathayibacter toxicus]PPG21830.1 hypothetical protein C5D15_06435 [Rathayibacter toxicus]PPG46792.1 hypothetical protein C5D16_06410 [Rathayibacter toxicus]